MNLRNLLAVTLLIIAIVTSYYITIMGTPSTNYTKIIGPIKPIKAKLQESTNPIFLETPWVIGRFSYQPLVKLFYKVPTDQIPSQATYVWVRIEIPDSVIEKLRTVWNAIKQGNENWFESFAFPQIIYAKRIEYRKWDFYPIKVVSIINKTQDGFPKVIDVKIWKVGNEWYPYIIVAFPSPFFEGFEEWDTITFGTELSPYKGWYYDTRSEGQPWIVIYDQNDKSDSRALRFPGNNKWAIIYKDINIPIQADKDIPIAIGFCRGGEGFEFDKAHAIILELEKKDGTTYKVGIVLQNGDHNPNYATIIKNKLELDCVWQDFISWDWWCDNRHYSLKEIIENYCTNIDWVDLKRIKRIYLAGTRERGGTNDINFIWIGDPRVYVK